MRKMSSQSRMNQAKKYLGGWTNRMRSDLYIKWSSVSITAEKEEENSVLWQKPLHPKKI